MRLFQYYFILKSLLKHKYCQLCSKLFEMYQSKIFEYCLAYIPSFKLKLLSENNLNDEYLVLKFHSVLNIC